jgi:AraC-like DNA-binding protein
MKADADRDFGAHVREVVARLLAEGAPDIRAVASALSTSARTLQRRLRGAGLTYAGLVQKVRCEAASHLLAKSGQTVGDVARMLGYSDPAHFARAFQRWTGLTPREFRRREHGGDGVASHARRGRADP